MSQCCGNALFAAVVESHHAAVAERQLQFSLALLAGNLTRHGAVYLVGEPVLAGHGFQLKHVVQVIGQFRWLIADVIVFSCHGFVHHDGLGRMAEHLCHVQIEGLHAVALNEREVGIACCFAHNVHRSAFTLGNLAHVFYMFLVNEQAHALLALVSNDFLGRERLVAYGQFCHINLSAAFFDKFREAVHVSGRTVVVDADYGIDVFFAKGTYQVVGALLHLGVGALHGVEFNAAGVFAGVHARDATSAEADAVVVAADHNYLVALAGLFFQAVATGAVAYAAGKHDDFVVAVFLSVFLVLEGEHRAGNERLSELVAEVAGAVGGFDEYLFRCLVEPLAHGQDVFPFAAAVEAGVGCHVDGCAGDGPRTGAAAHAVAYFTACSR